MCIYGMEGPGGYQLFGRTIQVWNTHRQTDAFVEGKPWLLRFFDQIRFFKVIPPKSSPNGGGTSQRPPLDRGRGVRIPPRRTTAPSWPRMPRRSPPFEAQRQTAFDEERAEWQRSGEFDRVTDLEKRPSRPAEAIAVEVPEGADLIEAPFGGSVWKLLVAPGDAVETGDVIAVIEAMKMECPFESPASGTVAALYMQERQSLQPGAPMLALRRRA